MARIHRREPKPRTGSAEPRRGLAAASHFLLWAFAAVAGVILVVMGLPLLGAFVGTAALAAAAPSAGRGRLPGAVLIVSIVAQLIWLAAVAPWYRRVRRHGIAQARAAYGERAGDRGGPLEPGLSTADVWREAGADPARETRLAVLRWFMVVCAITVLGVGLQVVTSTAVDMLLPLFPQVEREFNELMKASGINDFTWLSAVSVAVLAPIVEELTFRGISFQLALRAVTPAWSPRLTLRGCRELEVSPARFWVANAIQAAAFGIMHMNITQALYAFPMGLVLGWLFMRTGRLRYGMGLHLAVNLSSYLVHGLYGAMGALGSLGAAAFPVACVLVGFGLFDEAAPHRDG